MLQQASGWDTAGVTALRFAEDLRHSAAFALLRRFQGRDQEREDADSADDELTFDDALEDWVGCQKSFAEYQMLEQAQRKIIDERLGDAALHAAFARLSKLSTVRISEWRALGRPDESFKDCAERLFGFVLAPEMLSWPDRTSDLVEAASHLKEVISCGTNASIQTLLIGTHSFEQLSLWREGAVERLPIYISDHFFDNSFGDAWGDLLPQLKRLEIAVKPSGFWPYEDLPRLPDFYSLTHLTLNGHLDLQDSRRVPNRRP